MCVITNEKHEVVSVSFIPGLGSIPANWHCYFPVQDRPAVGDTYMGPIEDDVLMREEQPCE
jgi:hypothetical protein